LASPDALANGNTATAGPNEETDGVGADDAAVVEGFPPTKYHAV
jgi:hypothetical protein